MEQPRRPTLLVVSGPAATGKTTLARRLGERLSWPALCKDDLKESLFDSLGHDTPAWVDRLEVATYDLLFGVARTVLGASVSLVLESDVTEEFTEERVGSLQRDTGCRLVQVACRTEGRVLVERFTERMPRQHPGHLEAYYWDHHPEFRESLERGVGRTLDLESTVLTVDTTDFDTVDYDRLVAAATQ